MAHSRHTKHSSCLYQSPLGGCQVLLGGEQPSTVRLSGPEEAGQAVKASQESFGRGSSKCPASAAPQSLHSQVALAMNKIH